MIGSTVKSGRDLERYYYGPDDHAGRDLEEDRRAKKRDEKEWRRTLPRSRGSSRGIPWYVPYRQRVLRILREPGLLWGWLEVELGRSGLRLEEALATVKRGRLSSADRAKYDVLARAVSQLRSRGATLPALGEAIGKGAQTVSNLDGRGSELLHRPCKKHTQFYADCPACLRSNPDAAVTYSGPPSLVGRLLGGSEES